MAVKTQREINNKLSNWLLNEVNYILNKYKISIEQFFNVFPVNDLANIIKLDLAGTVHHNEIKKMFYDEFETRWKNKLWQ